MLRNIRVCDFRRHLPVMNGRGRNIARLPRFPHKLQNSAATMKTLGQNLRCLAAGGQEPEAPLLCEDGDMHALRAAVPP